MEPVLAYELKGNLYINITNRCTNNCVFCKRTSDPVVGGHNLRLEREPTPREITAQIGDPSAYEEVVFCGYGEPTLRLDVVKEVAAWLRENGARRIRLNTNGQGNLINGRDIVPELAGLIDSLSISLNACNTEQYNALCNPELGPNAYDAMKDFAAECAAIIGDVTLSVVDVEGIDVGEALSIAEDLGCRFRLRGYVNNQKSRSS